MPSGRGFRRRRDDAKEEAKAITGEMATIATLAVADARHVALNARRGLRGKAMSATGRAAALVAELERTAKLVERVVAQTRVRLGGGVPDGSKRVVSLHDADARPIAKGRLASRWSSATRPRCWTTPTASCWDHTVVVGNPADAPMLVPAIARITARFGHAPTALTADRGYGEAKVDDDLVALGVQRVAIPRRGKPGAARQKVQRGVPSPSWSSGARAARRASPTSSVTTAGHVHAPMGSAVPRGGVGGACSPTTPPRSAP